MHRNNPGGTLIFSYIRSLGSFFGVQNFEFQYFFWFSEKLIILGFKDFVENFLGSSQKIYTKKYLVVISMHLGSFLKVKAQNGEYFLGLVIFLIFWGER